MSKVFRITPKRIKRVNGTVLTPDMLIVVTTQQHVSNPFYNGTKEIQEQYMRMFRIDYKHTLQNYNHESFLKIWH